MVLLSTAEEEELVNCCAAVEPMRARAMETKVVFMVVVWCD
jgi:uncharacterized phage protein gp47/JayE